MCRGVAGWVIEVTRLQDGLSRTVTDRNSYVTAGKYFFSRRTCKSCFFSQEGDILCEICFVFVVLQLPANFAFSVSDPPVV